MEMPVGFLSVGFLSTTQNSQEEESNITCLSKLFSPLGRKTNHVNKEFSDFDLY